MNRKGKVMMKILSDAGKQYTSPMDKQNKNMINLIGYA